MRCYHFGNMYLSSIQQGIQAAHAQMELFVKYSSLMSNGQTKMLYDWAEQHKTMICLNAGFNERLLEIESFLDSKENPYPWASFCESEEAMGGMLTNVAVVLPERIYDITDYQLEEPSKWAKHSLQLTDYECALIRLKNSCRMAK